MQITGKIIKILISKQQFFNLDKLDLSVMYSSCIFLSVLSPAEENKEENASELWTAKCYWGMKNIPGKPDLPSLLFSSRKQAKNAVKTNQVPLNTSQSHFTL